MVHSCIIQSDASITGKYWYQFAPSGYEFKPLLTLITISSEALSNGIINSQANESRVLVSNIFLPDRHMLKVRSIQPYQVPDSGILS